MRGELATANFREHVFPDVREKAHSLPSHLLKYATSANSVPPMKPLGAHHGCDVVATIDALRAQKYVAYPPENRPCARATSSVPSRKK
jgi:hypothetical protein